MKKQDPVDYIKDRLNSIALENSVPSEELYSYCKHHNTFYIDSTVCSYPSSIYIDLSHIESMAPNISIKGDKVILALCADRPSDFTQDLLPRIVLCKDSTMYIYCGMPYNTKIVPIELPANYLVGTIHLQVAASVLPLATTSKKGCGNLARTIYCTPNAAGVYVPHINLEKRENYTVHTGCFHGTYNQFYDKIRSNNDYGFWGTLKYLRQVRQLIKETQRWGRLNKALEKWINE
jgi:hypothetical protein